MAIVRTSLLAVFATIVSTMTFDQAQAHGFLAFPNPRPMTAKFRANVGSQWSNSRDEEVWRAPLELFTGGSADFNINNGCRGFEFESENPIIELTLGQAFDVVWLTQASHPGPTSLSVARPRQNGTRTNWVATETLTLEEGSAGSEVKIPPTINGYGRTSRKTTLSTTLTGCDKPGDCTLQWYWDASAINQQYYNCADFVVKGGSASGGDAPAPAPTPAPRPTTAPQPAAGGSKCTRRARK